MATVYLNIYDLIPSDKKAQTLSKDALDIVGMGVHHSGVEILGEEISFGMDPTGRNDPNTDGIFSVAPRSACGVFKKQVELGVVAGITTRAQVQTVLNKIRPDWRAQSYHMLAHNCNCFTKAFVEALDPALLKNYPKDVNRIAGTGNVVVPNALLASITAAVNPPAACSPDLIGIIFLPNSAPIPPPLPLQGVAPPAEKKGGLLGFAKGAVSAVASTVKSVVDDSDKKEFEKAFPNATRATLVDAFGVNVIHINRVQRAKFFVTNEALYIDGANMLNISIPWADLGSWAWAKKINPPKDQANVPPTFEIIKPTSSGEASSTPDALLAFSKNGKCLFPFFDFTSTGRVIEGTKKLTGAGTLAVVKAMNAMDPEWRKHARV